MQKFHWAILQAYKDRESLESNIRFFHEDNTKILAALGKTGYNGIIV